jgi:ZIP family zinc transporter
VLSGAVEPIGAVLTIVAAGFIIPAMPFMFVMGFTLMMALDVALG